MNKRKSLHGYLAGLLDPEYLTIKAQLKSNSKAG